MREYQFPNVRGGEKYLTERDFEREIANRQKAGKPPLGHGFDLKCGHCTAGHRMPSRWRLEGDTPGETVQVAVCECGTVLRGDVIEQWKAHVREAVPTDPRGRRVA